MLIFWCIRFTDPIRTETTMDQEIDNQESSGQQPIHVIDDLRNPNAVIHIEGFTIHIDACDNVVDITQYS